MEYSGKNRFKESRVYLQYERCFSYQRHPGSEKQAAAAAAFIARQMNAYRDDICRLRLPPKLVLLMVIKSVLWPPAKDPVYQFLRNRRWV